MLRKYAMLSALAAASITGFAGVAGAQNPSNKPTLLPTVCVEPSQYRADNMNAQRRRIDDLNVERSSLDNLLAAARDAGDNAEAEKLSARIVNITTRIRRVEIKQSALMKACSTRT